MITKLILFLTAFGEFLIDFGKHLGKAEVREEQKLQAQKDIAHANNIRANADKLSNELLIEPKKRTGVNVLDLDPDLRGNTGGGAGNPTLTSHKD